MEYKHLTNPFHDYQVIIIKNITPKTVIVDPIK